MKVFLIVVVLFVFIGVNNARSNELAYDPFNYSPVGSPIAGNGSNSSGGFSGNWYGDNSFAIGSGNLTSPVTLPAPISNSVTAAAFGANRDLRRDFLQPLGTDNTQAFFSFIMRPEGIVGDGAYQGWFGFFLENGLAIVGVGKDSFHGNFSIGDNLGDQPVLTNVSVVSGQSHFFVLAATFLPGNDVYKLYIDPQSGQPQPAAAAATLNFDLHSVPTIKLTGPGAFGFDELRIGTTWADVTPVPEPSTFALLTLGSVIALAVKRRAS